MSKIKNRCLLFLGILFLHFSLFSQSEGSNQELLIAGDKHTSEAYVIATVMKKFHYSSKESDLDLISSRTFDNFFNILDPSKIYFLENDLENLESYRFKLVDQLQKGEIDFAFEVYNLFKHRVLMQLSDAMSLLQIEQDFNTTEVYTLSLWRDKWQSSYNDKNNLWRRMILNETIKLTLDSLDMNSIIETISLRLRKLEVEIKSHNNDNVFHQYMNAFSGAFDSSSDYLSSHSIDELNPFIETRYDSIFFAEDYKYNEVMSRIFSIELQNKPYKLGVITIPNFYIDFEQFNKHDKDYLSLTRDVKKLILDMKVQNIEGLMLDLRFNGGGPLLETIVLAGLFVSDGPILQVKHADQKVDVMNDEDGGEVFHDLPLVVLINRGSAAASEIFCAAIQDYKRGVIVGETSYGKGTIQNVINLNNFIRNPEYNSGYLNLTLAKVYRVNGASFQQRGIAPDVQFPSIYSQEDFGEASRPNALPWDEIANAGFTPTNNVSEELLDKLNAMYRSDLNTDEDLQKLVRDIEEAKKNREQTSVSLNLEKRKASQNKTDELETAVETGDGLKVDEMEEKLKKDPYLKEGLKLLAAIAKYKIG